VAAQRLGLPPAVTDAESVCLAVPKVLLRYDNDRPWLRAAPGRGPGTVADGASPATDFDAFLADPDRA
jgi:hypothetical protein